MLFERCKAEFHSPFYDELGRLNVRLPVPSISRAEYRTELDAVERYLIKAPREGEAAETLILSTCRPGVIRSWGYRFVRSQMPFRTAAVLAPVEVYLDEDGRVLAHSAPVSQVCGNNVDDLHLKLRLIRTALDSRRVLRDLRPMGFFAQDAILN